MNANNEAPRIALFSSALFSEYQFYGFFEGWRYDPDPSSLKKILEGSYLAFVAVDDSKKRIVGFITCISDGVLSCFIPLLEVLPEYRCRGLARALIERLLTSLQDFYMVDLTCDEEMVSFYERFGFHKGRSMLRRHFLASPRSPGI